MARELAGSKAPGAAQLAADFTASMRTQDPKLALNIMAEAFNVGLAPWADPAVRQITARTDLDLAAQLAGLPTVLILRCARRHTEAYGPYLGTILRVLTTRLDDLGERQPNGQLPIPVGLILEEFPALGRLDSLASSFETRMLSFEKVVLDKIGGLEKAVKNGNVNGGK